MFGIRNVFGKAFWDKTGLAEKQPRPSFSSSVGDDGAAVASESGYYGAYLDLDGVSRNESQLIERYRDISKYPDCESAIDDIVTQSIVDTDTDVPVRINLDATDLPDNIKKTIDDEFKNVCRLLDFNHRGHDIFRRWYIDGRLYYHKIVDEDHPAKGIIELRYLDPRKTKKVRTVEPQVQPDGTVIYLPKRELYVFSEAQHNLAVGNQAFVPSSPYNNTIEIAPESIACVTSGILDLDKNLVLGYLHGAIRPVNHLRMMEDSLVIARVSRAPERRIFYVDVSGLNKVKAEAHMKDLMNRYRNKIVYDANTGEVRDSKKYMSMLEDYWLPRTNSGKGTEISTLPGLNTGTNTDDIEFFKRNLAQALKVPASRFSPDGGGFNFGRVAEITRDELKFSKFIDRLRKRFSELFNDLMRTQLVLKRVMTPEDWDNIKYDVQYRFLNDSSMSEMRTIEDLRNKVDLIGEMEQSGFIGTYMSREKVKTEILRLTEEEIQEEQERIEAEREYDMQLAMQKAQMNAQIGLPPNA